MIQLRLNYFDGTVLDEVITPTVFPDGTTQVWKIQGITKSYRNVVSSEIIWKFENEAEFMHVSQLSDLVDSYTGYPRPLKILNVPFMPYGRQDKAITNSSTFAQRTFTKLVDSLEFDRVVSFDVHGICAIKNLIKLSANDTIKKVFEDNKYDIYCYPDGGACERYLHEPSINGVKERDPQTGKIEGYYLVTEYEDSMGRTHGVNPKDKRILIVDDLCDQGNTFLRLFDLLTKEGVGDVGLFVSHLVGKEDVVTKLKDYGIKEIFTTNSLVKNEDGVKIV